MQLRLQQLGAVRWTPSAREHFPERDRKVILIHEISTGPLPRTLVRVELLEFVAGAQATGLAEVRDLRPQLHDASGPILLYMDKDVLELEVEVPDPTRVRGRETSTGLAKRVEN